MEEFTYYIFCLIALVVGIIVIKKIAGCIIKSLITIVIIAVLAIIYYLYYMPK